MSDIPMAVYTIGQTPRLDLTESLADRFGSLPFRDPGGARRAAGRPDPGLLFGRISTRDALAKRDLRSLEVVVPFAAQATPATRKWKAAGFSSRAHVLGEQPESPSISRRLAAALAESPASALVFDYVGFPASLVEEAGPDVDIPVFDLGNLALDALERALKAL